MTEALYKDLNKEISESEHEPALKTLDKILSQAPTDETALVAKAICYIQLGKFQEALDWIESKKLNVPYERAYCLYRLNKLREALALLSQNDTFSLHLKAQIHYKLEEYEKCIPLYQELAQKKEHAEETLVNTIASQTLAGKPTDALATSKRAEDNTYELAYNSACAAIANQDLNQAKTFLEFAKKLCRESLADQDLTEEEIQDELAVILVQEGYLKQLSGKTEEAKEVYESIIKSKPSDSAALAIAANNVTAITGTGGTDLFDTAKKLGIAAKAVGKLTSTQQRAVNLNNALLLMFQKKYDECRTAIAELSKQFPDSDIPPLISSALLYREKKYDEAMQVLQDYIQKFQTSEKTLRVQLTQAQLHIFQGNFEQAITALRNMTIRHEPAIVGSLISLYQKVNQPAGAILVLDESIQYWKQRFDKGEKQVKSKLLTLLNKSAEYKMSNNKYEEAAATYEMLVKVDPDNKEHLAALVNAFSQYDVSKAENYSEKLPSIDVSDINAESLEAENVSAFKAKKQHVEVLNERDVVMQQAQEQDKKKKKKKKKKKTKLPKKYDVNKQPDPERWLPKKQRSTYKKKGATMRSAAQGSSNVNVQTKLQHQKEQAQQQQPQPQAKPQPAQPTASKPQNAPKPAKTPAGNRKKRK
jgi:signal recognition particle subunit SRP72